MGNSYILEASNGEALLIECGVRMDRIKKALNYKMSRVSGCLVTHEHQDHCKAVHEVQAAGIDIWASAGTHIAMGTDKHHRSKVAKSTYAFNCGTFKVKAFDAQHDCAEPLCYLIYHPECGLVLFLTDSYYCQYVFEGLHNIIIEANYAQDIVDRRLDEGSGKKFLRDRVLESHMSLDTCKKTLKSYDLSAVNNVVLIHLSDGNSDERRFKKEVEEVTGKTVHIARPGMTIPFNKSPF